MPKPSLPARLAITAAAGLIVALAGRTPSLAQELAGTAVFGPFWRQRLHRIIKRRRLGMNILAGYKTYIVAFAMLAFALAKLLGVDLPAFDGQAPGSLLMEALAIIFLRQGIKARG